MPDVKITLPTPGDDREREAARDLARWLNPSRQVDPERPQEPVPHLDPDSRELAALLQLSRALWLGEAAEVVVPLDDQKFAAFVAAFTEPTAATRHRGVDTAVCDLYYAAGGAARGISGDRYRALCLLEDALFDVHYATGDDPDDGPLRAVFAAALGAREARHSWGTIDVERAKFRAVVDAAERAMNLAERLLEGDDDTPPAQVRRREAAAMQRVAALERGEAEALPDESEIKAHLLEDAARLDLASQHDTEGGA